MNILIAFDSFKHAMTAQEACSYAEEAILASHPDWKTLKVPLSDGGEGFCALLTQEAQGCLLKRTVLGPNLIPQQGCFGLVEGKNVDSALIRQLSLDKENTLGIIEMASASGLEILSMDNKNPMHTSSFGTGQLLKEAAAAGADALLLGAGGSATNDLGLGALEALGLTMEYTRQHQHFLPKFWKDVKNFDKGALTPLPPIFIACDVQNPLLGEKGATATYGAQKGLRKEDFDYIEFHMRDSALKLCNLFGKSKKLLKTPGSGAAGGVAFALRVAYSGKILPGFSLISQWIGLKEKIKWADLILTGEGQLDSSSLQGKGPGSIIALAKKLQKPVELFVGCVDNNAEARINAPIYGITPEGMDTETALQKSKENIKTAISKRFM
mgnify:CR=1 FL=1